MYQGNRLENVGGISKQEIALLHDIGVHFLTELAAFNLNQFSSAFWQNRGKELQLQAQLQIVSANKYQPEFSLTTSNVRKTTNLPSPHSFDIFLTSLSDRLSVDNRVAVYCRGELSLFTRHANIFFHSAIQYPLSKGGKLYCFDKSSWADQFIPQALNLYHVVREHLIIGVPEYSLSQVSRLFFDQALRISGSLTELNCQVLQYLADWLRNFIKIT